MSVMANVIMTASYGNTPNRVSCALGSVFPEIVTSIYAWRTYVGIGMAIVIHLHRLWVYDLQKGLPEASGSKVKRAP